jgi:hypothetical protein
MDYEAVDLDADRDFTFGDLRRRPVPAEQRIAMAGWH